MLNQTQQERLARNESFFREVNERIREMGEKLHSAADAEYEFLCECPDPSCVERLLVSLRRYEQIRSEPRRFLVAPGHNVPEIEHLVASSPEAAVVEKDGAAGEVAEQLDPRG